MQTRGCSSGFAMKESTKVRVAMIHSFPRQASTGVIPLPASVSGAVRTTLRKGGHLRLKEDVLKAKKQVILVMLIQKRIKAKDTMNIHSNCDVSKVQI